MLGLLRGPVMARAARLAPGVVGVAAATTCAAAAASCASAGGERTLKYFPVPGGPGEVVRLVLALKGEAWNDVRVTGVAWGKIKPSAPLMRQMPILAEDGRELTQSRAIVRYLGKSTEVNGAKIYPDDPWLAFQVDELVDALEDSRGAIVKTFAIADQAEKEAARKAMFATDGSGAMFEAFRRVEARLPGDGHMVGGRFTIADAWAFAVVNQFRAGFIDGVPRTGWLEELPKLKAVVDKVAKMEPVRAYYKEVAAAGTPPAKFYEPHASC